MSDATTVTGAIQGANERMPIGILVCNAGVVLSGRFDEVSTSELEDTARANTLGSLFPIHAVIPLMKSRCSSSTPQSIVLVSSVARLVSPNTLTQFDFTRTYINLVLPMHVL